MILRCGISAVALSLKAIALGPPNGTDSLQSLTRGFFRWVCQNMIFDVFGGYPGPGLDTDTHTQRDFLWGFGLKGMVGMV